MMMWLFPLIVSPVAILVVFLVFSVPQALQAALARITERSRLQVAAIPAMLPLTCVLTWYCWEYFTPAELGFLNSDPDWEPFQHGMTVSRYVASLEWQTPVTLFSYAYYRAPFGPLSKKRIVIAGLTLAALAGVVQGVLTAKD